MKHTVLVILTVGVLMIGADAGLAGLPLLNLGPEELVQTNGADIQVPGYSVPSFVDWNNDNLNDLVVGQGGGSDPPGKVRVYLNAGTQSDPMFSDFFYAQSNGLDLTCPASGCLGCFPRVVYWDGDARKDLLVGQADGTVRLFLNTGSDSDPVFDAGQLITVGSAGANLDVGARATPAFLDWNNDNMTDLVIGAVDGKIRIYLNCGCAGGVPPTFYHTNTPGIFAQEDGFDLVVASGRSSPVITDLDGDGKKDILTGNTSGELLFYSNIGTDEAPIFSGYSVVTSDGVAIDLSGSPRSRPFVCDWTGDGYHDVLVGASDGLVHLYQSVAQPGDIDKDYDVDFTDFALLTFYYQQADCGECGGADLSGDGKVGFDDFDVLFMYWLGDARIR